MIVIRKRRSPSMICGVVEQAEAVERVVLFSILFSQSSIDLEYGGNAARLPEYYDITALGDVFELWIVVEFILDDVDELLW